MLSFGHAALAAVAAALCACTSIGSSSMPRERFTVKAPVVTAPPPAQPTPVAGSAFDAMRAALPGFDLQRQHDQASGDEVSIIRDLTFTRDSTILSRVDVDRLAPLHAYLRANPLIAVRITGYGDGTAAREREANLSLNRAHAVARALLTDLKVANTIDAIAAPAPQGKQNAGHAEIVFTQPLPRHAQ